MTSKPRRAGRPQLRALADRVGILPEYVDQGGHKIVRTSDTTREILLAAMGIDAPTENAARGWLAELDHAAETTLLDPVRVVQRDARDARKIRIRLPRGARGSAVEVELREESGRTTRFTARATRGTIELPAPVLYGYHDLRVTVVGNGRELTSDQRLIVVPSSCVTPAMLYDGKASGIVANLYSVRREGDWGIGDLGSYMQVVEWARHRGADFVGVNPLHALLNRDGNVGPYSPVSRLFRNFIYIVVEAVPELDASPGARALIASTGFRSRVETARASALIDYDAVAALKLQVLAELHEIFVVQAPANRRRDYDEFVARREPALTQFATWMTIAEQSGVSDWRQWPAALHDVAGEPVRSFQEAHRRRIDFHRWLQFEMDRQLQSVSDRARTLGMRVGVYQDLALGSSAGGSDAWSNRDLFLSGIAVGAPPDPYSAVGQNWGLPPIDPRALRRRRYDYWIDLLRAAFEHAGALRIDHVMGLFRLFWIPDGGSGKDGAYVRYAAEDLLGILALESVRHNALVVGEDLGTVPREVGPALRKWGIASSRVLLFERDARGFKPARRYPALALATANTHDMPPLAGWWSERDVALRAQTGVLPTAADLRKARRERRRDKADLRELLGVRAGGDREVQGQLAPAAHAFLRRSPAQLVGESLDDVLGETEPVNVPGVGNDKYPNWRRRIRMTMEEIAWQHGTKPST